MLRHVLILLMIHCLRQVGCHTSRPGRGDSPAERSLEQLIQLSLCVCSKRWKWPSRPDRRTREDYLLMANSQELGSNSHYIAHMLRTKRGNIYDSRTLPSTGRHPPVATWLFQDLRPRFNTDRLPAAITRQ